VRVCSLLQIVVVLTNKQVKQEEDSDSRKVIYMYSVSISFTTSS